MSGIWVKAVSSCRRAAKVLLSQMRDAEIILTSICSKSLYSSWTIMKKTHWSVMISVSCKTLDCSAGEKSLCIVSQQEMYQTYFWTPLMKVNQVNQ